MNLTFTFAVDAQKLALTAPSIAETPEADIRRRYVTRMVRQRLHQQAFRERVLEAYREHCSICRLRHHELLEAAHVVANNDLEAVPSVFGGRKVGEPRETKIPKHRWPSCRVCVMRQKRKAPGPMFADVRPSTPINHADDVGDRSASAGSMFK